MTQRQLKAVMEKNGIGIYELADGLGVGWRSVYRWLDGTRSISEQQSRHIALFLTHVWKR